MFSVSSIDASSNDIPNPITIKSHHLLPLFLYLCMSHTDKERLIYFARPCFHWELVGFAMVAEMCMYFSNSSNKGSKLGLFW